MDNRILDKYIQLLNRLLEKGNSRLKAIDSQRNELYKSEFGKVLALILELGDNKYFYGGYWDSSKHIPDIIEDDITTIITTSNLSDELKSQLHDYLNAALAFKKEFQNVNEISHKISVLNRAKEKRPDEWQFMPFYFISMVPDLTMPLNEFIGKKLKEDAESGMGFFENITDESRLDESIDELLGVTAYELTCSFEPFYKELHKYGVDALLGKDALKYLFATLNALSRNLKANTDKPNLASNRILDTITGFDRIPIWGIVFQILIIQGLSRLLECCTLSEKDNGFAEATSLYTWLQEILLKKLIRFIYLPLGKNDKVLLQPLCEYIYSTEIGQMVQNHVFTVSENEIEAICAELDAIKILPEELDNPDGLALLNRAVNAGILDDEYMPIEGVTKAQMKVFAIHASIECGFEKKCYKPFEAYWSVTNLAQTREVDSNDEKLELVRSLFSEDVRKRAKNKN